MKNTTTKVLLSKERFQITVERLCRQLIENYDDFDNTCIIGIQTKGVFLANRMEQRIREILNTPTLEYGKLDITFYRDDFRTSKKPLRAMRTEMDFIIENKKVILIDDVLYTGRTIQAALTALNHYGRPKHVELLTLVDRRFNRQIPIKADYVGLVVDGIENAYIKAEWKEVEGEDRILLIE